MKQQRGVIAELWLYVIAALAVLAAVAAVVSAFNRYTIQQQKEGYDRGVAATTAAFEKRDNAALQAAIAAQREAEDRAIAAEAKAAQSQAAASSSYQKGVKDGKAKTESLLADVRSGALRLRDPGNQAGTGVACGGEAGKAEVAGSSGGSNGASGSELSGAFSQFLIELTGEADNAARQLAAAQQVILSDRVLCNSP